MVSTFLYTNNTLSKKEIFLKILFIIAIKQNKLLGINITRKVKDLYSKTQKILREEIEDDRNKLKSKPEFTDWKKEIYFGTQSIYI